MEEILLFEYISARRIGAIITPQECLASELHRTDYRLTLASGVEALCIHDGVLVPESYWCFVEPHLAVKELMLDYQNLDAAVVGPFRQYFSTIQIDNDKRKIIFNRRPHVEPILYKNSAINFSMSLDDKNIYHFLILTLPKLLLTERITNGDSIPLLFGYQPTVFQLKILQLLNVTNPFSVLAGTSVHELSNKISYSFDRLYNLVAYQGAHESQIRYAAQLLHSIDVRDRELLSYDKIYVTRDDAVNQNRRMVNEQSVRDLLIQSGFVPITMSKFSVEQQIYLFKRAKTIVFEHGAAGAFLLGCASGQRVIEMLSPRNCTSSTNIATHYQEIAQVLGLDYTPIIGYEISADDVINYRVSTSELLKEL